MLTDAEASTRKRKRDDLTNEDLRCKILFEELQKTLTSR
jgi:hypothetical protein